MADRAAEDRSRGACSRSPERAEAKPSLPDLGPRPLARATVALVAVVVAALGIWGAFAGFRDAGSAGHGPGTDSEAFVALWPETSFAEAQQVQGRVDAGDPAVQWRTQAGGVALRYAEEVLGWPDPIAGVTTPADDPDSAVVSIHGPDASCQGAECKEWQPRQVTAKLTLRRLVRSGDGGTWSVTAVESVQTSTTGHPRPRIGGWPEDANGDGLISDMGDERIPELIKAAGDDGVSGYVRYEDMEGPQPSDPAEAIAISGQERVIPVYAADGVTVVDWLTVSSGEGPPPTPQWTSPEAVPRWR